MKSVFNHSGALYAILAATLCFWPQAATLRAADNLSLLEEKAIRAAVDQVAPSVVRIQTIGGLEKVGRVLFGSGPTTGLIVSEDGYIISSAFNFAQKPSSILVTLADSTRLPAQLVATDHSRLLVLLKVTLTGAQAGKKLPVPVAAPENQMRVGQWAIALGRTFEGPNVNISIGVISAVNRIWGKALQTDAKISPNNYGGPMVDIRGRVLGVLVPMSPQSTGVISGFEWYDAGVGFAVPLEHINHVLPKLKKGQDLHPGVMGISLKGRDMFGQPATIASARPNSPAYDAGLKPGDQIIEINGHKISTQAQLKHQISHRYAGETLALVVLRGKESIRRNITLVKKLPPYQHPFLGILPMRVLAGKEKSDQANGKKSDEKKEDADKKIQNKGVTVRWVYPNSPAAKAGIRPGEVILSLGSKPIKDRSAMFEMLSALAPGAKTQIEVRRDGKTVKLDVELTTLPETLPGPLPPARERAVLADDQHGQTGKIELKIPEFPNQCFAYVPTTYHSRVPHGVVVSLHAPGGYKEQELINRWKPLCERYNLILLAPKSADPARWRPAEAAFVRKVLGEILSKYTVDPARIVLHGDEGGGALAYLVAFASRDAVRAVAAINTPLPRRVKLPDNEPLMPMAIYTTTAQKARFAQRIEAGIKELRTKKYPVTLKSLGELGRSLNADELEELVRWIDALDRI